MPKQTPIQKAIAYCPEECTAMREYLQSLLAEEREMVEGAYERGCNDGFYGCATFPFDYFTQTYQQ